MTGRRGKKGSRILIRPSSRIPLDAVVVKGKSSVDESMLTDESIPVEKKWAMRSW